MTTVLARVAAFWLGFRESRGDAGMTYDSDPGSARSRAYDAGRAIGRRTIARGIDR